MNTHEYVPTVKEIAALLEDLQQKIKVLGQQPETTQPLPSEGEKASDDRKLSLFQDPCASDAESILERWSYFNEDPYKIERGLSEATQHFREQNEATSRKAARHHQWHDDLSAETKVTISYQKEGEPEEFVRCTLGTIPEGLPNPYRVKLGWPSAFVAPNRENSSKE
jgi:hypothetical protein